MILGYSTLYQADASERALPNAAAARALLAQHRPDIEPRVQKVLAQFGDGVEVTQHLDAIVMGLARLGLRHGGFGKDPHAYHNEDHILEVGERRLQRVVDTQGLATMPPRDWLAMVLFAACHDLRQRETFDVPGPVGGNEASSIAETFRILDVCGFSREDDRDQYVAMELMIAGSTFDPRPLPHNDGELATAAGGSLARGLGLWLDGERPDWGSDAMAKRGERLARLAADLDTANVAEAFPEFAASAQRLCREIHGKIGKPLEKAVSAPSCLNFLSSGQIHYFFGLHRFCSREGDRTFGPSKAENAAKVRRVHQALTERYAETLPVNGLAVIDAFAELCAAHS